MKTTTCENPSRAENAQRQGAQKSPAKADVLLVAVGFGASSRAALRWAGEFAREARLRLRLVHGTSGRLLVDPRAPLTTSRQSWTRETWLGSLTEVLQDCARRETGMRIAAEDVCVELGEPAELILRESARLDVAMVILGGPPSEASEENVRLAQALLRRCPRPMLFVGPQGVKPVVMAATDCSDATLPVLKAAWRLAGTLGDRVCLMHNVDRLASQFAERVGLPLTSKLADSVAHHTKEWLEKSEASAEVLITRESDNAQSVLQAARGLDADLLVVGVKREGQAPHGTAERILKEVQRSVLFVPITPRPVQAPPS